MARPKKPDLERRTVRYHPRFTVLEAAILEDQASAAGLTPPEYLHRAATGKEITVPARRSADPHLVTKLDRLGSEVRDMGNVVNQVATYCHVRRDIPYDMEALAAEIRRLKDQIGEALDQVVGEA